MPDPVEPSSSQRPRDRARAQSTGHQVDHRDRRCIWAVKYPRVLGGRKAKACEPQMAVREGREEILNIVACLHYVEVGMQRSFNGLERNFDTRESVILRSKAETFFQAGGQTIAMRLSTPHDGFT